VYLVKSIVPYRMSPLYPYPSEMPWYFYLSILSFVAYGYLLFKSYKKQWTVLFFGLSFFFVNIVFMLQILAAGQGFIADRFTYIAYFGLFFIYAYFLDKYFKGPKKFFAYGVSVIAIAAYSFMTWNQTQIWTDSGTLWTHVLKYYDNTTLPWGNRANYYRDNGQSRKALADYNKRIQLRNTDPEPFNSRARLYFDSKSNSRDTLTLALNDYNRTIELATQIKDVKAEYYVNRGATLARLGRINEALEDFNNGIKIDPTFPNGFLNRSVIYNQLGKKSEALADINSYLRLRPYSADIWYESGKLNLGLGNIQQSLASFNKAISYDPNKAHYYYERSKAYYSMSDFVSAKRDVASAQRMGMQMEPKYMQMLNGK